MTAPGSIGTRLLVFPEHEGLRLDQFLAAATSLSRRAARSLIGAGGVARNGSPTRVQSRPVAAADVIDVARPPDDLGVPPRPDLPPLTVLHRDRWLVAVAKPAGVLSQPSSRPDRDLALDQLTALHLAVADGAPPFLRLVHRLDRVTTGVVLFAGNPQATAPLARAWADRTVDRRYLAVVEGRPAEPSFVVDRPIGRDPDHRWRFRVAGDGRDARTEVRIVEPLDDDMTLVECRLDTGRTHQVRVHLSHCGHPVVGDRLYGAGRPDLAPRPLLHAAILELPHPKTGDTLRLVAPIPDDMAPYVPDGADATLGAGD